MFIPAMSGKTGTSYNWLYRILQLQYPWASENLWIYREPWTHIIVADRFDPS